MARPDPGRWSRAWLALAAVLLVANRLVAAPASAIDVGRQHLVRCGQDGAYCGELDRPLDPTGRLADRVRIVFEYYPPRGGGPPRGTLVATEGGPGFPATESRSDYLALFGPLRGDHAVVIMDNRGTGRSGAVDCRRLQAEAISVAGIAECGRELGPRAPLYSTAYAADDLAAVLDSLGAGRVDLYGDSYGTFFAQVFAVRHPDRLRSLVLDGSYPLTGHDAGWYPNYAVAMRRKFDLACARDPGCGRLPGPSMARLGSVLEALRAHPVGAAATDADGVAAHFTANAGALAVVLFGSAPPLATLRESDAAARAYLAGDTSPLWRLMAESLSAVDSRDPTQSPRLYSQGLAAAVQCQDAPQIFDMSLDPVARSADFEAALARRRLSAPDTYAPFTIDEYRQMPPDYAFIEQCVGWPARERAHPPAHRAADVAGFPATPVLVVSGEFDNMTGIEDGGDAAAQFPHATHVVIANSFHVNALPRARSTCGATIVRQFLKTLDPGDLSCTAKVPPLHLAPDFARERASVPPASGLPGSRASAADLQLAATALHSVADLFGRIAANSSGHGVGLRGGSFHCGAAGDALTADLSEIRWVSDVAVSGKLSWRPRTGHGHASLSLRADDGTTGRVRIRWPTSATDDRALIVGSIGGRSLRAAMPAP